MIINILRLYELPKTAGYAKGYNYKNIKIWEISALTLKGNVIKLSHNLLLLSILFLVPEGRHIGRNMVNVPFECRQVRQISYPSREICHPDGILKRSLAQFLPICHPLWDSKTKC